MSLGSRVLFFGLAKGRYEHSRRLVPTVVEEKMEVVVRESPGPKEYREERKTLELTVLSGSGLVRLGGDGEVDSNLSALEILSRDVVDASLSILDASHGHETEASRSVGLERTR